MHRDAAGRLVHGRQQSADLDAAVSGALVAKFRNSGQSCVAANRFIVERAVADGFTHVAFGDLFLEDVRKYREDRLAGTGLAPLFPLWGRPTDALAREMIAGGVRARISTLDPRVMPRELIGAQFDEALLAALPPSVDPCAERGEFHTCVTDGPMFAAPLNVEAGEIVEREGFVYGDLLIVTAPAGPA